jgi:hypothetical protein
MLIISRTYQPPFRDIVGMPISACKKPKPSISCDCNQTRHHAMRQQNLPLYGIACSTRGPNLLHRINRTIVSDFESNYSRDDNSEGLFGEEPDSLSRGSLAPGQYLDSGGDLSTVSAKGYVTLNSS